jgi:Domain of unknown function (DUF4129)
MAAAGGRSGTAGGPGGVVRGAGLHQLAGSVAQADGGPGIGPGIGRHAAQQLARKELSKTIYQPSLLQRFLNWLGRLGSNVNVSVPGGWWALIALIVAVVLVAAAVIIRIRPGRSHRGADGVLLQGRPLSARDHRLAAERSATAGDFSAAIIERVRAIAVELEQRGVLAPRPGRTADELAAEASRPLAAQASELTAVMRLFDEVMYGGRDGTQAGYQRARDLDARLQVTRPAGPAELLPAGTAGPVP